MDYTPYLKAAGVPEDKWEAALAAFSDAKERAKGLTVAKWKVRLFKASQIAQMMEWEHERLVDVRPDLADWDVAKTRSVTGHGDNLPWFHTPDGPRPVPGTWLNKDPESDEYKQAVEATKHWNKGNHPRSKEGRKLWYRRNAGENKALRLGMEVPAVPPTYYEGGGVRVVNSGAAWIIVFQKKVLGPFGFKIRAGFEIDNLWVRDSKTGAVVQGWFPFDGEPLKAPVTYSKIPAFFK